uniref:Uncharacterized protein n=1 Tax=Grammatophora oceanica TaxID=210454 RepID=A0A7S1V046_9STRA|mmetsp:Transcript_29095/g.42856  ORF Transcript_29095/g.42856 Transcript_29095/m.42856 type:complete len:111 (+) Transcript_29095:216-548(+)
MAKSSIFLSKARHLGCGKRSGCHLAIQATLNRIGRLKLRADTGTSSTVGDGLQGVPEELESNETDQNLLREKPSLCSRLAASICNLDRIAWIAEPSLLQYTGSLMHSKQM